MSIGLLKVPSQMNFLTPLAKYGFTGLQPHWNGCKCLQICITLVAQAVLRKLHVVAFRF